jgi:hypothetical protein
MAFLGQDWSFGNLKNKTKGLLADGGQGLGALQGNPLFGAGMGLLASSYDSRINPFGATMEGLKGSTEFKQTQEDREREAEYRRKMAEFFEAMKNRQMGVPGMPGPTPQEQALQMSLLPGMPGSSAPPMPPTNAPMSQAQQLPNMQQLAWRNIIGR